MYSALRPLSVINGVLRHCYTCEGFPAISVSNYLKEIRWLRVYTSRIASRFFM